MPGLPCPDCRGVRLHATRTRTDADGKTSRVHACSACGHETATTPILQPGIGCRHCGSSRMKTLYTRHRSPGVTVRVKRCKWCQRKVRTVERVECERVA